MAPKENDEFKEENERAREEMHEFEKQDELPSDLDQWPDGRAKTLTFGSDSDEPYGEGPTAKLGPPVIHNEDGSVTVDGEEVDNPDDYKGEPIEDPRKTAIPGRPDASPGVGDSADD